MESVFLLQAARRWQATPANRAFSLGRVGGSCYNGVARYLGQSRK